MLVCVLWLFLKNFISVVKFFNWKKNSIGGFSFCVIVFAVHLC